VSIGLPTYNGEPHLREALDSLTNQIYRNLEILISDNASTDSTLAIASEYAARDPRVRVFRHDANRGPAANFNFVLEQARGELFMWAGDDDRWAASYVTACVDALSRAPHAVLACTGVRFMDASGQTMATSQELHDNPDLSSRSVRDRVRVLLSRETWYLIYGLMRRDVLRQVGALANTFGADVVLAGELALRGPFVKVPEPLYFYRKVDVYGADRGSWHQSLPNRDQVMATPYSFLQESFSAAIARSPVSLATKLQAWAGMLDATVLQRTPLRTWLIDEARPRLRLARKRRDLRAIAKYSLISAAIYLSLIRGRLRHAIQRVLRRRTSIDDDRRPDRARAPHDLQ